ncbi:hypothetical protein [Candidatus Rhabdochlamydia sp. W815]|uniref:hypothetical protein n=1 Tax=Candidatus Rhabdochlamydia sp. W815 TaxID=2720721 RepID=UPI001BFC8805|nr:hypothetical protein [Candidatus Rhabdochlamydia sp. W815]KAG6559261.1 hypothetical protein RHOW815_000746 [Candidatus Rhabdochlamydia sp. W815]
MKIHNNTAQVVTNNLSSHGGYETPPSTNRVEEVAFDVVFSQEPLPGKEKLRFKLKQCGKTGSQYYTIVKWRGKRYRITVHDNKRKLAYSEADWQRIEHRTIKVLNKVQREHFFRGTLQLHAKTKKKWKVYKNKSSHIKCSVNKKVIREFKNLLENQIKSTNIFPATKAPVKRKASNLAALDIPFKQVKKEEASFPKKIIEKIKNSLSYLKSNTDEDTEKTERKKGLFKQAKNYFFPSNDHDNFDDLASSDTASIRSFEESDNRREGDFDDNTSLGGITVASSHISSDSGSSYSPKISPEKK